MNSNAAPASFPGHSIVVGIDEHDSSDNAVLRADQLGRAFDLPVHLVHGVGWTRDLGAALDPFPQQLWYELETRVRRQMQRHLRALSTARSSKTPPELHIAQGNPAKVIVAEARAKGAGLIVLGPHHKRGILDFGSTLRGVYARAHVPVWMEPGPVEPVRSILAAVDLSPQSLAALDVACTVAASLDARVHVLHCWKEPLPLAAPDATVVYPWPFSLRELADAERAAFETAMARVAWHGVAHDAEFVEQDAAHAILDAAARADLVVLGTQGRTGLASVVLGGVAYEVLKRSPKPTLAIPAANVAARMEDEDERNRLRAAPRERGLESAR